MAQAGDDASRAKVDQKGSLRGSRMRHNNAAKEAARHKLTKYAMGQCRERVESFIACSKEAGFWVVLKCRPENKHMNKCLNRYSGMLDEYYAMTKEEFLRTGKITTPVPPLRKYSSKLDA